MFFCFFFCQEVYSIAKKSAQENGALLELKDTGKNGDYNKIDFMNMSIAAKVDGIILQYNGEAGLEEKINEAVEADIPVVTVIGDAVHSKRQSFVGVSDYQLGTAYGEKVAEYVNEDTKSILILLKKNIDDMNQSQIYCKIKLFVIKGQDLRKRVLFFFCHYLYGFPNWA